MPVSATPYPAAESHCSRLRPRRVGRNTMPRNTAANRIRNQAATCGGVTANSPLAREEPICTEVVAVNTSRTGGNPRLTA